MDHVADNVKDQSTVISAFISYIQEYQTALFVRLAAMEANQASTLENQSIIINLLCKVASSSGINTDDVPKGKKRKREDTERKREEDTKRKREDIDRGKREQAKKKASKDKCKRNAKDEMKDGSDDDGVLETLDVTIVAAGVVALAH